jgi:hypothetical protein
MAQAHPRRIDDQPAREDPLQPDRHVAQADRAVPRVEQRPGDDPDGVGEVDEPGAARRPRPRALGDVKHHGHGTQRLGQAARAGGLLAHAAAVERPGLVPLPGGLAADPKLQ